MFIDMMDAVYVSLIRGDYSHDALFTLRIACNGVLDPDLRRSRSYRLPKP